MLAVTKILAGGAFAAALVTAAPATAQYYPGYGYGYGGGGVGQVINQVFGGGYRPSYANQQVVVNQCAAAVQQRLSGGYGYNPYGYNNYAGGRVLGISRVEPRSDGGLTVRGVASSGRYNGYAAQSPVDLTWRCRTDYRGLIRSVDLNQAERNYGNGYGYGNNPGYSPYANDYSQYGYSRY